MMRRTNSKEETRSYHQPLPVTVFTLSPLPLPPHPSSLILHHSSFITHPSSLILHHSSFITHPSSHARGKHRLHIHVEHLKSPMTIGGFPQVAQSSMRDETPG